MCYHGRCWLVARAGVLFLRGFLRVCSCCLFSYSFCRRGYGQIVFFSRYLVGPVPLQVGTVRHCHVARSSTLRPPVAASSATRPASVAHPPCRTARLVPPQPRGCRRRRGAPRRSCAGATSTCGVPLRGLRRANPHRPSRRGTAADWAARQARHATAQAWLPRPRQPLIPAVAATQT